MRGATMVLVVYSHVCNYCLGDSTMGFNGLFFLFRLPCFFLISGWLFYGAGQQWHRASLTAMVRKKFMVQVVPTVLFLLLLTVINDSQPPQAVLGKLGAQKGGYWFTFTLFEFFILYALSSLLFRRRGGQWAMLVVAVAIAAAAFWYDVTYRQLLDSPTPLTTASCRLLGVLGFMTWRYYLFFFLGTLARKHFSTFVSLTRRKEVVLLLLALFVAAAAVPRPDSALPAFLVFALGGVSGMTLVFTLFRSTASPSEGARPLQYIGRRTLDIYLLHYFFLPRFLLPYGAQLHSVGSPLLESAVAMAVALPVTVACLAVSHVVRFSPFMGHLLFGVHHAQNSPSPQPLP